MKLFWDKLYGPHGLRPRGMAFELEFGTLIHACATDETMSDDAKERGMMAEFAVRKLCEAMMIQDPLRTEWPIFARALIYAFRSRVWPEILKEYEVIRVEGWLLAKQLIKMPDGTEFYLPWRTRPDLILKHKKTGDVYYWDLKTTSLDTEKFCKVWGRSPQLHLGAWVYEKVKGEKLTGCVIQGLHKGSTYKGSLRGPLVTMYASKALSKVTKQVFRPDYAKGFDRQLISEHPEGIEGWVDKLPRETVSEIFPVTPVIVPDEQFAERLLTQTADRAREIAMFRGAIKQVLDDEKDEGAIPSMIEGLKIHYFPMNDLACEDVVRNRKCKFYEACHNPVVRKAPEESGLYELKPKPEELTNGDE